MRALFLLFIIMPIVEMLILIEVGSYIGAWYTVGLVLLTAVIGVNLLKQQGLKTLMSAQHKAQQGALPLSEIGEGLLLAIAGALLLTPGFVTDGLGFTLLVPSVRQQLAVRVARQMVVQGSGFSGPGDAHQSENPQRGTEGQVWRDRNGKTVIDAEFEKVDEHPPADLSKPKK